MTASLKRKLQRWSLIICTISFFKPFKDKLNVNLSQVISFCFYWAATCQFQLSISFPFRGTNTDLRSQLPFINNDLWDFCFVLMIKMSPHNVCNRFMYPAKLNNAWFLEKYRCMRRTWRQWTEQESMWRWGLSPFIYLCLWLLIATNILLFVLLWCCFFW